ncbi:MAG TPA: uridylate kinase [Methanothrix sp.]|nr:uridylate kinase [Methanothrix sp.]HPT19015.1 uridylate kinase [Methanothrix sp.]
MPFYVLKVGGSLMATARDLVRSLVALKGEGYSFLVVPGGGPMADLVREIYSRGSLSQEAAHWMAVLAMEQYARFLADGTGAALTTELTTEPTTEKTIELITDAVHLPAGGGCAGMRILLPYQALLRDDFGIEHNWDCTSDAVAALVAARLRAPLIKATDVDGIFLTEKAEREISAARLLGVESCLDQGTVRLLCSRLQGSNIWILNGSDPQKFILSLKRGEGGTVVKG